jgi:hypothetical protein
MALIQPLFGQQLVIQVGNGATPEVFSAPSLINTTRGLSISTSVESDELVDLADQGAPAQMVRRVKSTDIKIDGAGMVHKPAVLEHMQWVKSGAIKNVKVTDGAWTLTGPVILSSFQITGERLKSSECQMTYEQAGEMTLAPSA